MLRVDIACNHPNTGMFEGRAWKISFPNDCLELDSHDWERPPRFVEIDGAARYSPRTGQQMAIRLAGKVWPITSMKYGIGNWCWNGYWMKDDDATAFLIWLKRRGLYHFDAGWCELSDWWNDPHSMMEPAFIKKILRAAQHRGSLRGG